VIQSRQKSAAEENLLADDLAARATGLAIQERLTKNIVALCATTLYVQLVLVLSGTTSRVAIWALSGVSTA
jgi:hypothetical protein